MQLMHTSKGSAEPHYPQFPLSRQLSTQLAITSDKRATQVELHCSLQCIKMIKSTGYQLRCALLLDYVVVCHCRDLPVTAISVVFRLRVIKFNQYITTDMAEFIQAKSFEYRLDLINPHQSLSTKGFMI